MSGELAATRRRMTTATATTATKKKKKKGRPSLLDIQKRSLKQQQQLHQQFQNPNSIKSNNNRRSTRRHQNPNFNHNNNSDYDYDHDDEDGGGDDDDERHQRKHKLLLGLHNSSSTSNHHRFSSPNSTGPNSVFCKIHTGSDHMEEKVSKATDTLHGLPPEDSGPTIPLPDKKLLVFVLDRLQKKDTYGVFSEPVDREELPDYHEIVANPMDFATVRKKLDAGAYTNLEEFEKDVFLICSNAMQYNAPDTIYFRQARSIQELAKKDLENLRQDSDDSEPEAQAKVVRRGRPPKSLKKSLGTSPSDRIASEFSSDATLANGGENPGWASAHNLRRGPTNSVKFQPADALNRASHGSHTGETHTSWLSEWENEFPASVVRAVLKYGKKQFTVDENRRDTYKDSMVSEHESSVLTTFEGQLRQLTAVGLNSENGYARSLAQFAAGLGPVVWKIASKKIESVLPTGVKFSPGFAGEDKATEQQQYSYTEKQRYANNYVSGDHSSRLMSPSASGSNSIAGNRCSLQAGEDIETIKEVNSQSDSNLLNNNTFGGIRPGPPIQIQSRNAIHSGMNGFGGTGGFGFIYSPHVGMVGLNRANGKSRSDSNLVPSQMFGMAPNSHHMVCPMPSSDYDPNTEKLADCSSRLNSENLSVLASDSRSHTAVDPGLLGDSSWQGLSALHKQEFHPFAPDLNVGFLAPGSPISNLQIGSPQQPDLALQL